MNPGELRSKIKILKYENIDGVYTFNEFKKVSSKVENEIGRKTFSKFGMRSDETAAITLRYRTVLNKSNAIEFNGEHYLVTAVEDIDNRHMYLKLVTVKQDIYLCEAFRNSFKKDEMNRPKQVLESVYRFQGYLLEKYSGYNDEKISYSTTKTLILMTPKVIELKSGDIVEINSIRYNVELTHLLDDYFNEYEISAIKDV